MAGAYTSREEDTLEDDKEAFKEAQDHEADNRREALDDIRFARLAEQWPPEIRRRREEDARPCLTINQLPAFIREVVNTARQNKPGVTVHPADSKADAATAEIINGLIRQIERTSDAEVAYDTALDNAVTGGFGYIKINTRYATDDTFDQDIVIERVANPFSIYGDPNSTAADSSDWMSAFEIGQMTKSAFKRRWKGREAVSFDSDLHIASRSADAAERLTVAARWIREEAPKEIVAISMPDPAADPQQVAMAMQLGVSDQLIVDLEIYEENQELFQALGMTVIGSPRPVMSYKVTQRILSGADVLEEHDWGGKYIPIVPVYGEEINVEGIRHFRGLVRDAKDPQRNLNYWRSAATEMVALQSKAPWVVEEGSLVGLEKWDNANTQSWPYLEYKKGSEPPQRQPFAGVPAGAIQEAANAADDMKRILGMFTAPVSQDNESSGRAILARQKEGDVATFHFIDNLSRAIRHTGRIVLDLIPKVYSTQRVLRIVKADGTQAAVAIGPQQPQEPQEQGDAPQPSQAPVGATPPQPPPPAAGVLGAQTVAQLTDLSRIYDLTVGKYDLTVQAGPSYATLREELNTILIELIRAYPPAAPAVMDLIVKTLDIPDAQEVADRIQQLSQGGAGNPQAAKEAQQMQAALEQANNQIQQLQQKIAAQQSDLQEAQIQAQTAKADQAIRLRELDLKESEMTLRTYEAQTDRLQAETEAERVRRESLQAHMQPTAPVMAPGGMAA